MSTLYQVLGLPRGATEQQVKAAFRTLARRFHPDLNAGDEAAEQRFKEVNHAYETLADPGARAAYDRALACRLVDARKRFWTLAATATATFALTAGTVSLAAWWGQHARARQPVQAQALGTEDTPDTRAQQETHGSEGAKASPRGGATVGASQGRRKGSNWATYQNARFSFALKYPVDVFAFDKGPANDNVRILVSRNGDAVLRIFATENITGTKLAQYRRSLIEMRYAGAVFDQTQQRKSWFVLSGTHGDTAFYERVTFSCDGRSIHGWQMIFPSSERTLYDLVVDEVHRNYTHTSGPGARCGDVRVHRAPEDRRG
jgi:curved DNA-binding protein CbpA